MAKEDSIIELDPPALRFWDKLGLAPRGGSKDAESWVVYQEREGLGKGRQPDTKQSQDASTRRSLAQQWLSSTQRTYQVKSDLFSQFNITDKSCKGCNMGHLTSGTALDYTDGILPISFDSSFRKHLSMFTIGDAS